MQNEAKKSPRKLSVIEKIGVGVGVAIAGLFIYSWMFGSPDARGNQQKKLPQIHSVAVAASAKVSAEQPQLAASADAPESHVEFDKELAVANKEADEEERKSGMIEISGPRPLFGPQTVTFESLAAQYANDPDAFKKKYALAFFRLRGRIMGMTSDPIERIVSIQDKAGTRYVATFDYYDGPELEVMRARRQFTFTCRNFNSDGSMGACKVDSK
ncbi:MAG: hypothetical protein JSR56_02775 [Proteobacteria bacterium]|nr:hypothetical protein [Pseudomonadota bacterium]